MDIMIAKETIGIIKTGISILTNIKEIKEVKTFLDNYIDEMEADAIGDIKTKADDNNPKFILTALIRKIINLPDNDPVQAGYDIADVVDNAPLDLNK